MTGPDPSSDIGPGVQPEAEEEILSLPPTCVFVPPRTYHECLERVMDTFIEHFGTVKITNRHVVNIQERMTNAVENGAKNPKKFIQFFQALGILAETIKCCMEVTNEDGTTSVCGKEMFLVAHAKTSDAFRFRCSKHRNNDRSVRTGSYFSLSRLELGELFEIVYYWSLGTKAEILEAMYPMSNKTIVQWYYTLRETCTRRLADDPIRIGGEDHIVEIDETQLIKLPKNNVGRREPDLWFFGCFDRTTKQWVGEFVPTRNRRTLIALIVKYILPGSTIYSDKWAAYVSDGFDLSLLEGMGYSHLSVNHWYCFFDHEWCLNKP
jgi:hypothetical protein